ncbi:TPA: sigma-54-dependent Fis family transcriptional regulator [Candidatus Sumerlaeota bacterium]|nr:sigma-54-dependent Fis family transcriptional regulator [Candidatus Sumerlaeota bacterium]
MESQTSPRVLVVDDEPKVLEALVHILGAGGYACQTASNGEEALALLTTADVEIIVCDLKMPKMGGMELIRALAKTKSRSIVIILTGHGDIDQAVEATRLGAYDFLSKPVSSAHLLISVARALEYRRLEIQNTRLTRQIAYRPTLGGLVGESAPMLEVFRLIAQVAPTDISILVTGETGTGKEEVARAIHRHSLRHDKRFSVVDCAAIPENLLESILFGHKKGAFTGAERNNIGLLAHSDGGTVFFDEIGDLPLLMQSKLLRVLQERTFTPVGDVNPMSVDIRVVAATNRNLQEDVREGRFREDLFFRLNVLNIHIPPLRDRRSDISLLAFHFLEQFMDRFPHLTAFTQETISAFLRYNWPGNVRELRNAVERAASLSITDALQFDDLPDAIREFCVAGPTSATAALPTPTGENLVTFRSRAEREYLISLMIQHQGNISHAAQSAGTARNTFYKMLRDAGLRVEDFRKSNQEI